MNRSVVIAPEDKRDRLSQTTDPDPTRSSPWYPGNVKNCNTQGRYSSYRSTWVLRSEADEKTVSVTQNASFDTDHCYRWDVHRSCGHQHRRGPVQYRQSFHSSRYRLSVPFCPSASSRHCPSPSFFPSHFLHLRAQYTLTLLTTPQLTSYHTPSTRPPHPKDSQTEPRPSSNNSNSDPNSPSASSPSPVSDDKGTPSPSLQRR